MFFIKIYYIPVNYNQKLPKEVDYNLGLKNLLSNQDTVIWKHLGENTQLAVQ